MFDEAVIEYKCKMERRVGSVLIVSTQPLEMSNYTGTWSLWVKVL